MKKDNNITINLDNPNPLAMEITNCYINNLGIRSLDYGAQDLAKYYVINYTMVVDTLNSLKDNNVTFEALAKEFCDKYKDKTN